MNIMYVFLLSVVVQSVFAMEKQVPCTPIETIKNIMPDVKQPMSISYVRKGVIVALGSEAFIIRDIKKKQNIMKKKNNDSKSCFSLDNQGTKVAIYKAKDVKVYNIITKKKEWSFPVCKGPKALYFNQEDNSRLICCNADGTMCLCDKSVRNFFEVSRKSPEGYIFAYHPKKTKIFISTEGKYFWILDHISRSNKYQLSQNSHLYEPIFTPEDYVLEQCYSPDGSVVALRAQTTNTTTIALLYVDDGNKIEYLSPSMDLTFNTLYQSMLFHPNNNILFLLDIKNTIECWDFKNKKCIHAIYFSNQPDLPNKNSKRLACSAGGKKLFVALQNQCTMVRVPLNVLYAPDTIKNMIFVTFTLQKYDGKRIVKDVQYVILKKLLKLYRNEKIKDI